MQVTSLCICRHERVLHSAYVLPIWRTHGIKANDRVQDYLVLLRFLNFVVNLETCVAISDRCLSIITSPRGLIIGPTPVFRNVGTFAAGDIGGGGLRSSFGLSLAIGAVTWILMSTAMLLPRKIKT